MSKVELSFQCFNLISKDFLSASDPVVYVYELGEIKLRIGRTEIIQNSKNPVFNQKVQVEYYFEKPQFLEFIVVDIDNTDTVDCFEIDLKANDLLGKCQISLAELIRTQKTKFDIDSGQLVVSARNMNQMEVLQVEFKAENLDKKDVFGLSDPYLVLYRVSDKKKIAETEVIKNTLNPVWKKIQVPLGHLITFPNMNFFVECYDWDAISKNDLIGSCLVDTMKLCNGEKFELINQKKAKKTSRNSGLLYGIARICKVKTFSDYLAEGLIIKLGIAIDFTASNLDPKIPASLHNLSGQNSYQNALYSVGTILAAYDVEKMFCMFGFGASIQNVVHHDFFIADSPWVYGVEGALDAYRKCLDRVVLSGPTLFAPVISRFTDLVSKTKGMYHVFMIITDGAICDMNETKAAILEASKYPISIVIVGVGNADFKSMQELDDMKTRDIVQFVPMSTHDLCCEVLREIPSQVCEYFIKE